MTPRLFAEIDGLPDNPRLVTSNTGGLVAGMVRCVNCESSIRNGAEHLDPDTTDYTCSPPSEPAGQTGQTTGQTLTDQAGRLRTGPA